MNDSLMHESHALEHNLKAISTEKQTITSELSEIVNALQEVTNTKDDVYKIIGQVMIKSEKNSVIKELEEKRKVLDLRLNAVEKQEKLLEKKALELREEILKSSKKN